MVAVLFSARLDALKVGACARLGHGDGADQLAGGHLRQPLLLLLFRAIVKDVGRDDGIVQRDAEAVDADMADRLDDRALMGKGAARAAIFLGDRGAKQAVFAGLLPALAVEDLGLLELLIARRNLGFEKARGHVVEHGDFFIGPGGRGKVEDGGWVRAHDISSPSPSRGRWPRSGRVGSLTRAATLSFAICATCQAL